MFPASLNLPASQKLSISFSNPILKKYTLKLTLENRQEKEQMLNLLHRRIPHETEYCSILLEFLDSPTLSIENVMIMLQPY